MKKRHFGVRAFAVLLAVASLVAACASTPEASLERDAEAKGFHTHPGWSAIYVYRPDFGSGDSNSDVVVFMGNRLVGSILRQTYFRIDAEPGVHWLHGYAQDQGNLRLETRPGEVYFVELRAHSDQSHYRHMESGTGKQTLLQCCGLLENWAPGQRPLLR